MLRISQYYSRFSPILLPQDSGFAFEEVFQLRFRFSSVSRVRPQRLLSERKSDNPSAQGPKNTQQNLIFNVQESSFDDICLALS